MNPLSDYGIEVFGFHGNYIYFTRNDKKIILKKSLPRTDVILLLGIAPEEYPEVKDEILIAASKKPLSEVERDSFVNMV